MDGAKRRAIRLAVFLTMALFTAIAIALIATDDLTSLSRMTVTDVAGEAFGMVVCTLIFSSISKDRLNDHNSFSFLVLLVLVHMLLFWDVVGWLFDGDPSMYFTNEFLNYYMYVLVLLIPYMFWLYLYRLYKDGTTVRRFGIPMTAILVAGLAMLACNLFTGWYFTIDPSTGVYSRSDLFILSSVAPAAQAVLCTVVTLTYERNLRRKIVFLCYVLIPLCASVAQAFVYGTALQNMSMMFMIVVMYANIYLGRSGDLIHYESEMTQQRAAVMVSQIQPHFLYNALTAIMNIKGNPPETRDAIAEFGNYMRKNLDSLTQVNPIPFSREIDHVESYLLLVERKYGDRLDVRFDVRDGGFFIPPLTIKIILEEAVKHNLLMTDDERVHMVITAEREGSCHRISILNLEPTEGARRFVSQDGEDILTMKKRLQSQVGGTLENRVTPEGNLLCLITVPVTKEGA